MERISTPVLQEPLEMTELEFECIQCKKKFKREITYRKERPTEMEIINNIKKGERNFFSVGLISRNNPNVDLSYCSVVCKEISTKITEEKRIAEHKNRIEERIQKEIPKIFYDIDSDMKNIDSIMDKSLFITGKAGVGKSVLMATLCKKHMRLEHSVWWISYPKFIMELQRMFKNDENPYQYAQNVVEERGILAIDDLGAEKITDFVRQITYYIINEREQNMKRTIITSNFSLKEIDEMIDPRISSRIAGMCDIIDLKGKDRRIK